MRTAHIYDLEAEQRQAWEERHHQMQPLQELLHRIKWDAQFARGEFALGYYDRILHQEKVVPFTSISMDPGTDSFSFHGEDGIVAHIPLHRVRTVYKDGDVIWQRPGHPQS